MTKAEKEKMMKVVTGNLGGAVIAEMTARTMRGELRDRAVIRAEGEMDAATGFAENVLWAMGYTIEEADKLIDKIVAEERKNFEEAHK